MTAKRKEDTGAHTSRYRSERLVADGGKWYFLTREGAVEGPFECEADAVEQLEVYVRLAVNGLLLQECDLAY